MGGSLYSEVLCPSKGEVEGPCKVKSYVQVRGSGGGSLYSEVLCPSKGEWWRVPIQ